MMTRLSRLARFFTLLIAAMQLAVPAVVSVADGSVARSARTAGPHIEAAGQKPCPSHSADCGLCQFLSHSRAQPEAPARVVVSTEVPPAFAALIARRVTIARSGIQSRAPPTLPV